MVKEWRNWAKSEKQRAKVFVRAWLLLLIDLWIPFEQELMLVGKKNYPDGQAGSEAKKTLRLGMFY